MGKSGSSPEQRMSSISDNDGMRAAVEGQHEHTVDSKGRVSLPAEFRSELNLEEGSELIVTRHLNERCSFTGLKRGPLSKSRSTLRQRSWLGATPGCRGAARRVRVDRLGRIRCRRPSGAMPNLKEMLSWAGKVIECWSTSV